MKKIDISTKKHPNTFTLVDDCDYEELSKHKWGLAGNEGEKLYVIRKARIGNDLHTVSMHAAIMGTIKGKETDHVSGDTLDNQRQNLRHCTAQENSRNRGIKSTNLSGYKGVSWARGAKKWRCRITIGEQTVHLGYFTCLVKAANYYDTAAKKYFKEFAKCNFK